MAIPILPFAALVSSLALLLGPTLAAAQGVKAGVVTQLQGKVVATHATAPEPVALKYRDDVFLQDKIVTGDQALARVLLGGMALLTLREHSLVTLTEVPGQSTLALSSGTLSLAVAREKMKPGQRLDIRTPNAIAAVRGTVVAAEASPGGPEGGLTAPPSSTIFVLNDTTGKGVEVTQVDPASGNPIGSVVILRALQRFDAVGAQLGRVSSFPVGQIPRINPPVPISQSPHVADANNGQIAPGQMQDASALSTALTPPPPTPNLNPAPDYTPPPLLPGGNQNLRGLIPPANPIQSGGRRVD
jgi:FecR protein